jgi:hypothetical protein
MGSNILVSIPLITEHGQETDESLGMPAEIIRELGAGPADLRLWRVRLGYYEEASHGDYAFINVRQRQFDARSLWLIDCPVLGYCAARSRLNGERLELIGPNGKTAPVDDDHRERVIGRIVAVLRGWRV